MVKIIFFRRQVTNAQTFFFAQKKLYYDSRRSTRQLVSYIFGAILYWELALRHEPIQFLFNIKRFLKRR